MYAGLHLNIAGLSAKHVNQREVMRRLTLEKIHGEYAQPAVFGLPARIDPFGIIFVEAMRARLP